MNTVSRVRKVPAIGGQLRRLRVAGGHRWMIIVAHPKLNSPSHCPIMNRTRDERHNTSIKYSICGAGIGFTAGLFIIGFTPLYHILGLLTLSGTCFGLVTGISVNGDLDHNRKREQLDWYMGRLSKHN